MALNREITVFEHGVQNLLDDEIIDQDAASDAKNWIVQDGKIELIPGKLLIGAAGAVGNITGEIFGYKVDSTKVHYRKAGTKIQYNSGTSAVPVWTDIITGLTASADYSFTNYASLAGAFTFAIGIDGIFKMVNANPGNYIALYDSAKNFKGKAFIDKGRMILWDKPNDKTGLYGSKIDPQNGTVYNTVTAEATTSLTGTLGFKGGDSLANCFGVQITLDGTSEVYTDNFLGILTGSLGGTGTINYVTGAYTVSNSGTGKANYQWEDSNINSLTDFRFSSTRVAGEGFVFRQDKGGDAILNVLVGSDGYYSIKQQSTYLLSIGADDLTADNNVYRETMGVQSYRGSLSTSLGIVFINTANLVKPEFTILQKNITDSTLIPVILFPDFKFSNYTYDDATFKSYDRYILVACKSIGAVNNDTTLLCNVSDKTISITNYAGRTFADDSAGNLFMGSSITQSTYQIFSGFDDDGFSIENYWISKGENFAIKSRSLKYAAFSQSLKKYRRMRLRGGISPTQAYAVYLNFDDAGWQLVGTVLGSGSYVDYSSPQTIGSNTIGGSQIGGDTLTAIYPYFVEIRLKKMPKFRKRKVKFVALGIGYVDVDYQMDWDISLYEGKIPSRFRQKQNVSLDGQTVDEPNPEF